MEESFPSFSSSSCFLFFFFLLFLAFPLAHPAADQACATPIESLLDCLPYTQGKAQQPTASCCSNMKTVFQTQKKCLCELIAASAQGQNTGLPPINQTLALNLPVACSLPADPSVCPGLLGISPSSPEAQIFGSATNSTSSPHATNGTSNPAPISQTKGQTTGVRANSSGGNVGVSPNLPVTFLGATVMILQLMLPGEARYL